MHALSTSGPRKSDMVSRRGSNTSGIVWSSIVRPRRVAVDTPSLDTNTYTISTLIREAMDTVMHRYLI
jgi:hypothetical protein